MTRTDPGVPFGFVPPPPERNTSKPCADGLTTMMDRGAPLGQQRDWLELQATHVGLAILANLG